MYQIFKYMKNYNSKIFKGIVILIVLIIIYCVFVFTTMRFKHPEYTETQLFLSFIKAFMLDFN